MLRNTVADLCYGYDGRMTVICDIHFNVKYLFVKNVQNICSYSGLVGLSKICKK